jgi:hypothetical protein
MRQDSEGENATGKENRGDNDHCPVQPRSYVGSTADGRRCDFRCGGKGQFKVEQNSVCSKTLLPKRVGRRT